MAPRPSCAAIVFGLGQYATSNFISVPLADVVASLLSAAAVVLLVRVWKPRRTYTEPAVVAGGAADEPTPEFAQRVEHPDSRADVVKAYAPYAIIIAVFVICQITAVKKLLDKATVKFQWPGLDVVSPKGKPVTLTEFTLNLLTTPGTQMLIAGVLTAIALKAVGAPGAEGVRNDTASAALGDPHGDGGAGAGVRDEPVRPDDHAGHLDGRGRQERSHCCRPSSVGSALRSPDPIPRPTRCSARCRSPRRTRPACPMC